MNWLRKLFARGSAVKGTAEVEDEIITGWVLSVPMNRRTPLAWLLRHGEEAKEKQPVPPELGIWIPRLKSWRELEYNVDEPPKSKMSSETGYIPEDGDYFLTFLIKYRRIIEGDSSWEQMLEELAKLEIAEPEISGKLGGLVQYVIAEDISRLAGAGMVVTERLMDAGYRSAEQVRAASVEELCEIEGIGKVTAGKLKAI